MPTVNLAMKCECCRKKTDNMLIFSLTCRKDSENEEDIEKFAKFLEMVKNLKIDDIEEIETEQELLKDKIPFDSLRYIS